MPDTINADNLADTDRGVFSPSEYFRNTDLMGWSIRSDESHIPSPIDATATSCGPIVPRMRSFAHVDASAARLIPMGIAESQISTVKSILDEDFWFQVRKHTPQFLEMSQGLDLSVVLGIGSIDHDSIRDRLASTSDSRRFDERESAAAALGSLIVHAPAATATIVHEAVRRDNELLWAVLVALANVPYRIDRRSSGVNDLKQAILNAIRLDVPEYRELAATATRALPQEIAAAVLASALALEQNRDVFDLIIEELDALAEVEDRH